MLRKVHKTQQQEQQVEQQSSQHTEFEAVTEEAVEAMSMEPVS
jgi:hypothetical protein